MEASHGYAKPAIQSDFPPARPKPSVRAHGGNGNDPRAYRHIKLYLPVCVDSLRCTCNHFRFSLPRRRHDLRCKGAAWFDTWNRGCQRNNFPVWRFLRHSFTRIRKRGGYSESLLRYGRHGLQRIDAAAYAIGGTPVMANTRFLPRQLSITIAKAIHR